MMPLPLSKFTCFCFCCSVPPVCCCRSAPAASVEGVWGCFCYFFWRGSDNGNHEASARQVTPILTSQESQARSHIRVVCCCRVLSVCVITPESFSRRLLPLRFPVFLLLLLALAWLQLAEFTSLRGNSRRRSERSPDGAALAGQEQRPSPEAASVGAA